MTYKWNGSPKQINEKIVNVKEIDKGIYCINIYKGLRVQTDGLCNSCCMQSNNYNDEHGNKINIATHTFDQILNCKDAIEIRDSLNNGIQHPYCERCWIEENSGIESKRQRDLKNISDRNDKIVEASILDLCVSNLCNLKCRTCGPNSSSKWEKEESDIYGTYKKSNILLNLIKKAFCDDSIFWEEFKKNFLKIKHLDLYGGEPFLVKKLFEVLQYLIDKNVAKDISIHFNTNGTIWNDDIFNILKEFKQINLDISVDGISNKAKYLRYPSDWNNVLKNIENMYEKQIYMNNFIMGICCSISNINIFYIDEVMHNTSKYCRTYLNLIHFPEHFSIQYLPDEIKDIIKKKLIRFSKNNLYQYANPKKLINFMYSKSFDKNIWDKFLYEIKIHDQYRNEDFKTVFSEYYNLIKKYGYDYEKL